MQIFLLIAAVLAISSTTLAFRASGVKALPRAFALFDTDVAVWSKAKPIHTEFKVEPASPEMLKEMDVTAWPTWTTAGSEKYVVGKVAPMKVYDTNELSYIISGSMEIIPKDTGVPVLVKAGDFVTFPEDFACQWKVIEEINKHWYCYLEDGSPDV